MPPEALFHRAAAPISTIIMRPITNTFIFTVTLPISHPCDCILQISNYDAWLDLGSVTMITYVGREILDGTFVTELFKSL